MVERGNMKSIVYISFIVLLLAGLFSACRPKDDVTAESAPMNQETETTVIDESPEPVAAAVKPERFVEETVLLGNDSAYKHYSQVIVTRNDEIVVPVEEGFLYWENPEESLEPQFFEVSPVLIPIEEQSELAGFYYKILDYQGEIEPPLDSSLTFEELAEKFHQFNNKYLSYYRIPLLYYTDRSNSRYRFLYKTYPVELDLSGPVSEKSFNWIDEFQEYLNYSDTNAYESDQTDLFIYEGYLGSDRTALRNDESPAFFNPERGERFVLSKEMLYLDDNLPYLPFKGNLSVTRFGNAVSVDAHSNSDHSGDRILGVIILSLSSEKSERMMGWKSPLRWPDRRVNFPGGVGPNDIHRNIFFYNNIGEVDPFHPLIQVGENRVVTPYSDREDLEWVEFDGTTFSDVNGPTMISTGLVLSFNFSTDRRYLYLFRDSDNALARYTVIFDEE